MSHIKLAAFFLWIAAILLVIQPVALFAQACSPSGDCCPECDENGDGNPDQTQETTCDCVSCLAPIMMIESTSLVHPMHTNCASPIEITLHLQALACSIFHPPIVS
jgi:hypothetical protein